MEDSAGTDFQETSHHPFSEDLETIKGRKQSVVSTIGPLSLDLHEGPPLNDTRIPPHSSSQSLLRMPHIDSGLVVTTSSHSRTKSLEQYNAAVMISSQKAAEILKLGDDLTEETPQKIPSLTAYLEQYGDALANERRLKAEVERLALE